MNQNSRLKSGTEKKGSGGGGGFKLLDIAHGAVQERGPTNGREGNEGDVIDEKGKEENPDYVAATKEDCLRLLRESFDGYDYNGNGNVAHVEVREAWLMCQHEWNECADPKRCDLEATIFMKDIDKNGDDRVDFEDYVRYFRSLWWLSQGYMASEEVSSSNI